MTSAFTDYHGTSTACIAGVPVRSRQSLLMEKEWAEQKAAAGEGIILIHPLPRRSFLLATNGNVCSAGWDKPFSFPQNVASTWPIQKIHGTCTPNLLFSWRLMASNLPKINRISRSFLLAPRWEAGFASMRFICFNIGHTMFRYWAVLLGDESGLDIWGNWLGLE